MEEELTQIKVKEAIENLDFEEANRLTKTVAAQNNDTILEETNELELLLDIKNDNIDTMALLQRGNIDVQAENKCSEIVSIYNQRFVELCLKHQKEIKLLTDEWTYQHQQAENIGNKKINDLFHTSKVLAKCDCFEEASKLRDKVFQNENQIIYLECGPIDRLYKMRFISLNERQRAELEALYSEMEIMLNKVDGEINTAKADIAAEQRVKISQTNVKAIKQIANSQKYNFEEKKTLINYFSPKKLPRKASKGKSNTRFY